MPSCDAQVGLRHAVLRAAGREREPKRRRPGARRPRAGGDLREVHAGVPVLDRSGDLLGRLPEEELGDLELLATVLLHVGESWTPSGRPNSTLPETSPQWALANAATKVSGPAWSLRIFCSNSELA